METLLSNLDKEIDDMEVGRMHAVDEVFQMIRLYELDTASKEVEKITGENPISQKKFKAI